MYHLLSENQLNRLHHIKNALARVVVAAPRSSISEYIIQSLLSFKVQEHIDYKSI